MKCFALFITAFFFSCRLFAQGSPCAANTSRCLTAVRSGVCASWTAAGNGIVDPPDPACADAPGPAFDGQYWLKYTPTAGVVNISVKVDITALGGGTNPLLDAAFQLYSQPAASDDCTNGPFTLINCYNNAAAGVDEVVQISGISDANVYYIRIFEVGRIMDCAGGDAHDDFILCLKETGETACASKVISSLPFDSGVLNNTGFGNDNTAGCPGKLSAINATGEDYWFVYNSAGDEYVTMHLEGTDVGDKVAVKVIEKGAASCDAAASLFCYDDVDGSVVNGSFGGALDAGAGQVDAVPRSIYLESAGDYYFIFDTDAAATSNFTFKLNSFTPAGKDICSSARDIGGAGPYTITINDYLYTGDAVAPGSAQPGAITYNPMRTFASRTTENTKWFTFTINTSGVAVTLSINSLTGDSADGASPDLQLITFSNAAFTSSCTGFSASNIYAGDCPLYEFTSPGSYSCTPVSAGDAVAGRVFFIQMDGNAGAHIQFDVSTTNTVLPIELLYFNGKAIGNSVYLLWATVTEINNDYFTVERTANAALLKWESGWDMVAEIKGAGNSSTILHYEFVDTQLPSQLGEGQGVRYYRLKQTDYDGHYSYSDVIAVKLSAEIFSAEIFSNPAGEVFELIIYAQYESDYELSVYRPTGEIVRSQNLEIKKGKNSFTITSGELNTGIYFVQLKTENEIQNFKMVKK